MPQWVGGSDNEDQRMPNGEDEDDVRMPDDEDDVDKHHKVCCSLRKSLLLSHCVLGSSSREEAS